MTNIPQPNVTKHNKYNTTWYISFFLFFCSILLHLSSSSSYFQFPPHRPFFSKNMQSHSAIKRTRYLLGYQDQKPPFLLHKIIICIPPKIIVWLHWTSKHNLYAYSSPWHLKIIHGKKSHASTQITLSNKHCKNKFTWFFWICLPCNLITRTLDPQEAWPFAEPLHLRFFNFCSFSTVLPDKRKTLYIRLYISNM